MSLHRHAVFVALLSGSATTVAVPETQAQAARAQTAPALSDAPVVLEDVQVVGRRGSTSITPEMELERGDIDAFGADTIRDFVDRAGQALGLGEEPVLIINGRRVLAPGGYLGFPPDALERAEVLPIGSGAAYGGPPSARVLNLVMKRRFRNRDAQIGLNGPTAGGQSALNLAVQQGSIVDMAMTQGNLNATRSTALSADDRPTYLETHPGSEGTSLRPASRSINAGFNLTRPVGDWSANASLNAAASDGRSTARVSGELRESRNRSNTLSLDANIGGQFKDWFVRTGLNAQFGSGETDGLFQSSSRSRSLGLRAEADGTLFTLPAGPVRSNLSTNLTRSRFDGETGGQPSLHADSTARVEARTTLPLFAPKSDDGASPFRGLGRAEITLGASGVQTGDGSGTGLSANTTWTPAQKLRFTANWAHSADAVSERSRLEPLSETPAILVFDFQTGQSVEVVAINGGNPDLRTPTSDQFGARISAGPYTRWMVNANLGFSSNRTTDSVSGLPVLTPAVEAAFPDRFQRDEDGRLVRIDQRSINLAEVRNDNLNTSINFAIPFGGRTTPHGPGIRLSLGHNLVLEDIARIRADLAEMNRLSGDGGGVSRHRITASVYASRGQISASANMNWQSGYRTRRDEGRDGPDDLVMGSFGRLNLNLDYRLTTRRNEAPEDPASSGARSQFETRLGLAIDNVLDSRAKARLGDGRPAPGYGRYDRDPVGRTIRLTLSRQF